MRPTHEPQLSGPSGGAVAAGSVVFWIIRHDQQRAIAAAAGVADSALAGKRVLLLVCGALRSYGASLRECAQGRKKERATQDYGTFRRTRSRLAVILK